jgi:hypothetical protein
MVNTQMFRKTTWKSKNTDADNRWSQKTEKNLPSGYFYKQ